MNRIDGYLRVSRGFGDFDYKQGGDLNPQKTAITVCPDVMTCKRDT